MTQPVRTWPSKDPDAVLDFVYRIPLDAGDSVSNSPPWITKLSGDVVIDSQSLASAANTTDEGYGQDVTIWLSGGTDGETALFEVSWTTAGTRLDDGLVQLPVVSSELPTLLLTDYMKPSTGHLIARYPAFADVPGSTIAYWLTDAERYVTDAWTERDYAAGLMALAAHNMTLAGLGTDAAAISGIPTGITRMKSGSLELGFTDAAANGRMGGDLLSTRYGAEYRALLIRNRGGVRVQPTGSIPCGAYPSGCCS
jgi:hypothetical protein